MKGNEKIISRRELRKQKKKNRNKKVNKNVRGIKGVFFLLNYQL
jgi:hypothetical protein